MLSVVLWIEYYVWKVSFGVFMLTFCWIRHTVWHSWQFSCTVNDVLYWTKNTSQLYLFKYFCSQSVGLWYSSLLLFLFFLCYLRQLVVNPTDTKKQIHTGQGNMVSEVWGWLSHASGLASQKQGFIYNGWQKPGSTDKQVSHRLLFYSHNCNQFVKRSSKSDSVTFEKILQWTVIIWSGVPFQIRKEKRKR